MPFDFINYKNYSINYSKLFNDLNSKEILDNPSLQTQYLNEWRKVLERHDEILTKQLQTQKAVLELQIRLHEHGEPEIFQLPIDYPNNEVLIHFRASVANKVIDYHKPPCQDIPIDEFIRKDGRIKWNPVGTNVDSYSKAERPIIIVPFLNNKYNLLVIDGNHRLTYKVNNKADKISALALSEQSTIEYEIFSSGFDKMFYIMNNELNHMANATHYEKASSMQIIQKSYLTDGKYKFQEFN